MKSNVVLFRSDWYLIPNGLIHDKPVLVHIMAWCRPECDSNCWYEISTAHRWMIRQYEITKSLMLDASTSKSSVWDNNNCNCQEAETKRSPHRRRPFQFDVCVWNHCSFIQIWFWSQVVLFHNDPVLFHIMPWGQTGNNAVSWPILVYRKTSNISRTSVGNIIVDNSDVVGAPPVGAAPTTSSFST